jgi:hypothetical protein
VKDEITAKLTDFLNRIERFSEESQVLYVLVELRKLLDHYGSNARLLRFYADWSVHISKDRINKEFESVSAAIYKNAVDKINAPHPLAVDDIEIVNFAHGHTLAEELEQFIHQVQLPTHLVTRSETWNSFVSLLVKVLENQPIIRPCDGIAKMYFESAAEHCVILRIDFTDPVKGYAYYRYMSNLPN